MQRSSRVLSYYELSTKFASRVGAGPADEVLAHCDHDPSVRLFMREPVDDADAGARMHIGTLTLTDDGRLLSQPARDPTEELGAWADTFRVAMRTIDVVGELAASCIDSSAVPEISWWMFDVAAGGLVQIIEPSRSWLDSNGLPSELLAEVLVRFGGPPSAVTILLARMALETAERRKRDARWANRIG